LRVQFAISSAVVAITRTVMVAPGVLAPGHLFGSRLELSERMRLTLAGQCHLGPKTPEAVSGGVTLVSSKTGADQSAGAKGDRPDTSADQGSS
jgi:hypothetical protein